MKGFLLFCGLLLAAPPALASYRAYILWVVHYRDGKPVRAEKVQSTMDPAQYTAFHGLASRARVTLVNTWYCPGDTAGRDFCPAPQTGPTRGPASTAPKRGELPISRQPMIPR